MKTVYKIFLKNKSCFKKTLWVQPIRYDNRLCDCQQTKKFF